MSSPAQEHSLPCSGSVVGSELSSLLSSMLAGVTILHFQTGVWISAASSAQQQQTGRNGTRVGCSVCRLVGILASETESLLNPSVLWCQTFIYVLTKESDNVKKLRGHYENGTKVEFGSQGTS